MEICRFEVPISRFLAAFFKHSKLVWFRGWIVWVSYTEETLYCHVIHNHVIYVISLDTGHIYQA